MKKIFEEVNLGQLKLKNRLIRSATWEGLADEQGHFYPEQYQNYEVLAKGGVGMIITGFTSVSANDNLFPGMARLSSNDLIADHKKLVKIIHQQDIPVMTQLALGEFNTQINGKYRINLSINALSLDDIHTIEDLFVSAADRAVEAGYDGVQVHAAHGFFLSRFISPYYNQRKDEYGGSQANRARILTTIISRIRQNHPTLHITMKINSSDFILEGLTPSLSLETSKLCAAAGLDSIEASGAGTSIAGIKPGVNEGYFQDYALALADQISLPIILVGGNRTIKNMEEILNAGKIEFMSLSRPLIRQPNLPNLWKQNPDTPALCISCNMCYQTPGHRCIFNMSM